MKYPLELINLLNQIILDLEKELESKNAELAELNKYVDDLHN